MSYWARIFDQRMVRRRVLALTGTGIAAAMLVSCGSGNDSKDPKSPAQAGLLTTPQDTSSQAKAGGVLKDFQNGDVLHLDSLSLAGGFNHNQVSAYAYPGLMKFLPGKYPKVADFSLEGNLAEAYELSADKLQLTFKLRPGLKWDSRSPTSSREIDSQDVIWSWTKFGALNQAGPSFVYNAQTAPQAPVESISAPDARTVVMKLRRPDTSVLMGLATYDQFYVMPRESESQFDPKKEVRGYGPYTLEEWRPSAFMHWKRNPDYYVKGRPYYDRIEKPIITEYAQQIAQFRAGNIHTSIALPQDIIEVRKDLPQTRLRQAAAFTTDASPYLRFGYEGDSPFKDVRMRQAVSLSIDREAFLDTLDNLQAFRQEGISVDVAYNTVVSPGWGSFWLDPTNEKEFGPAARYLKYNKAEAKKLIAAAGYPDGVDFDFIYNQDTNYGPAYARTRDVYAGILADVGLRPRMAGKPFAIFQQQYLFSYISKQFASGEKKGYNGILLNSARKFASVDAMLFDLFHRDGAVFAGLAPDGKNAYLGDPRLNDALEKIRQETDRKRQQSLVHDAIRYFTEQMYVVPRAGVSKGLNLAWPVIGNEGVWNSVDSGNIQVESRLNWWFDSSQPPEKA